MIDALKWAGSLLCAAALVFLIYVHGDEHRLDAVENWIGSRLDDESNRWIDPDTDPGQFGSVKYIIAAYALPLILNQDFSV